MGHPEPLHWRGWWLAVGWALLLGVVYFSLLPSPPRMLLIAHIDKVEHLLAYLVLMGWFAQIEHASRRRFGWVVGLVLLGGLVELLQGWGGVRDAEWSDWLADAIGVGLGWMLTRTALSQGLYRLEARLRH